MHCQVYKSTTTIVRLFGFIFSSKRIPRECIKFIDLFALMRTLRATKSENVKRDVSQCKLKNHVSVFSEKSPGKNVIVFFTKLFKQKH